MVNYNQTSFKMFSLVGQSKYPSNHSSATGSKAGAAEYNNVPIVTPSYSESGTELKQSFSKNASATEATHQMKISSPDVSSVRIAPKELGPSFEGNGYIDSRSRGRCESEKLSVNPFPPRVVTLNVYATPYALTPNNEPLYLRYGNLSAAEAADAAYSLICTPSGLISAAEQRPSGTFDFQPGIHAKGNHHVGELCEGRDINGACQPIVSSRTDSVVLQRPNSNVQSEKSVERNKETEKRVEQHSPKYTDHCSKSIGDDYRESELDRSASMINVPNVPSFRTCPREIITRAHQKGWKRAGKEVDMDRMQQCEIPHVPDSSFAIQRDDASTKERHTDPSEVLNCSYYQPLTRASKRLLSDSDKSSDPIHKRSRMVWSSKLHDLFMRAVKKIGLEKAVPTTILQEMDVEGVTRENVASHLQKYRGMLKKERDDEERKLMVEALARNMAGAENMKEDHKTELVLKAVSKSQESNVGTTLAIKADRNRTATAGNDPSCG